MIVVVGVVEDGKGIVVIKISCVVIEKICFGCVFC